MKSKLLRVKGNLVVRRDCNKETIADLNDVQVERILRASWVLEREGGQLPAQAE